LIGNIAIVIVLAKFDQQGLPDWPQSITLNTFLALSTTLSKAAFMVPVSIAISQAKWTWFLEERPLHDFSILDQSSRGVWGSLILLWRVRFRHFIALGALLTIAGILTSPVSQLAIRYPVRDVVALGEEATARTTWRMKAQGDGLSLATTLAMRLALAEDTTNFMTPISPRATVCSTGNCTFDQYPSLGVCMKTTNITSLLEIEKFEDPPEGTLMMGNALGSLAVPGQTIWNVSLPVGNRMVHQSPASFYTDMLNGNNTLGFANDTNLLQTRVASFIIIHTIPTDAASLAGIAANRTVAGSIYGFRHEAHEFLFHLCVQTYETAVQAGLEHTRMVSELAIPVEPTGDVFLDIDCGTLLGDIAYACKGNESRWDEVLDLERPASIATKKVNRTDEEAGFNINYAAMESMASQMKSAMEGYGRLLPDDTMQVFGGDFPFALLDEVILDLEHLTNSTRLHTRITNMYMNVAIALSFM